MLSKKNDIDQLFNQTLEPFEKTPPDSVWEGIENRLIYRSRMLTGLKAVSISRNHSSGLPCRMANE